MGNAGAGLAKAVLPPPLGAAVAAAPLPPGATGLLGTSAGFPKEFLGERRHRSSAEVGSITSLAPRVVESVLTVSNADRNL